MCDYNWLVSVLVKCNFSDWFNETNEGHRSHKLQVYLQLKRLVSLLVFLLSFFVCGTFQPGKDGTVLGMTDGGGLSDFIQHHQARGEKKESRKDRSRVLNHYEFRWKTIFGTADLLSCPVIAN